MSFAEAPLRKLLKLFYAPSSIRISDIRKEIRTDIGRARGEKEGGGDFHIPFWADAKKFVTGEADLSELVAARVASAKGKGRLYPLYARGFLNWWNTKRRWRNEPLVLLPTPPGTQLDLSEVPGTAKIGGKMVLESGPNFHRVIYPYFAEQPVLGEEAARLGLWAMTVALPDADSRDLRLLDVLRGNSFAISDVPFDGEGRNLFVDKYRKLIEDYENLRLEY